MIQMDPNQNPLSRIKHKKPDFNGARLTLLIGNSESGKSMMVRQFIIDTMSGRKRRYKKILLLCPTHHLSQTYDILPDEWKFSTFDVVTFFQKIQETQARKVDPRTKTIPDGERILLILDDCIGKISGRDVTLQEIAGLARHYKVDVIIVSQHTTGLACPIVRSNTTFTILGLMNDENRNRVNKLLASYGKRAEAINYVNRAFSDPYRFIVLSNKPGDLPLYTYKVDLKAQPPNFTIRLKPNQREENKEDLKVLKDHMKEEVN